MVIFVLHYTHTRRLVNPLPLFGNDPPDWGPTMQLCLAWLFAAWTALFCFVFPSNSKRIIIKVFLPWLQRAGSLSEAIVKTKGQAEWKIDSLQSSTVVFCLRCITLAYTPITPKHWLLLWTDELVLPFLILFISLYDVFIFSRTLSSNVKAESKDLNHGVAPNNPANTHAFFFQRSFS